MCKYLYVFSRADADYLERLGFHTVYSSEKDECFGFVAEDVFSNETSVEYLDGADYVCSDLALF